MLPGSEGNIDTSVVALYTKETSEEVSGTATASSLGRTGHAMRANGGTTEHMGTVATITQTGIATRESGEGTGLMEKALTKRSKGRVSTRAHGGTTCRKDMDKRYGQMGLDSREATH